MQGPIPSVNYIHIEIRKQLSKMGRNKVCGPDDLRIEAIFVVAELKPELLTYILQIIMANGITDSRKKVYSYRYPKTKMTSSKATITGESS